MMDTYPVAYRKFTIPYWRMFGLDMKDTIQRFERDEMNSTCLNKGTAAYAIKLAFAVRDFNTA